LLRHWNCDSILNASFGARLLKKIKMGAKQAIQLNKLNKRIFHNLELAKRRMGDELN
jgi:hypothetical protein